MSHFLSDQTRWPTRWDRGWCAWHSSSACCCVGAVCPTPTHPNRRVQAATPRRRTGPSTTLRSATTSTSSPDRGEKQQEDHHFCLLFEKIPGKRRRFPCWKATSLYFIREMCRSCILLSSGLRMLFDASSHSTFHFYMFLFCLCHVFLCFHLYFMC